jgi:hypothetical protein
MGLFLYPYSIGFHYGVNAEGISSGILAIESSNDFKVEVSEYDNYQRILNFTTKSPLSLRFRDLKT